MLTGSEKKSFARLSAYAICIDIADLGFLAILVYLLNALNSSPAHELISREQLPAILLAFAFAFAFKNLFTYYILKSQFEFVYRAASRLSGQKLLHYFNSDYQQYVKQDSSIHIKAISQQPIEFGHYVLRSVQVIISQAVIVLLTIIALCVYDIRLFGLLFALLVPAIVLIGYVLKQKLSKARRHARQASEKVQQHLQESLHGFVEANLDHKQNFFWDRYFKSQVLQNNLLSTQQVVQNIPSRLFEIFAIFGLVALLYVPANQLQPVAIATMGAFIAAAYRIIPGIVKILNAAGLVKTYAYTFQDPPGSIINKKPEVFPQIETISFEHVYFNYNDQEILHDFNLHCKKGDFLRLAGISGKGKTTVINLLLGFIEPMSGRILINGSVLAANQRKQYWPSIAYIKQQSFFINDSIRKNICLSEQCPGDSLFQKALQQSGLDRIISRLPKGVETEVKENGKNFSGGERQRIIVARALYKQAEMLIFDEPFSELDADTRFEIASLLKNLSATGKTVWLVSHHELSSSLFHDEMILAG